MTRAVFYDNLVLPLVLRQEQETPSDVLGIEYRYGVIECEEGAVGVKGFYRVHVDGFDLPSVNVKWYIRTQGESETYVQ